MTATGLGCESCGTELPPDSRFCNKCGAPITPAATSAEYKQVTVLFADVVHSMDIAAAVGAERLREIMADLADRCAAVVKRFGGTVDNVLRPSLQFNAVWDIHRDLWNTSLRTVNPSVTLSRDARLARHVGNAVLKVDARGTRLATIHEQTARRIDVAVAAVMAHARECELGNVSEPIIYLL
jgi:class 3 adenylate cyclase